MGDVDYSLLERQAQTSATADNRQDISAHVLAFESPYERKAHEGYHLALEILAHLPEVVNEKERACVQPQIDLAIFYFTCAGMLSEQAPTPERNACATALQKFS